MPSSYALASTPARCYNPSHIGPRGIKEMGKFARSWALMKASANILRQDKELMLFPLLAGLASLVVIATFAWPVFTLISHHQADFEGQRQHVSPMFMLVSFLFYFVQYSVVIFFNVALASAALIRLDGGNPTLGDGIRTAMGKLPNIIGYALIAATVGHDPARVAGTLRLRRPSSSSA